MGTGVLSKALGAIAALFVAASIGCGDGTKGNSDGGVSPTIDATTQADAALPTYDATPADDAMPADAAPPPPQDRSETVPLSGRVSGGNYQMDVQLGHWVEQKSFAGGDTSGDVAATIKR